MSGKTIRVDGEHMEWLAVKKIRVYWGPHRYFGLWLESVSRKSVAKP